MINPTINMDIKENLARLFEPQLVEEMLQYSQPMFFKEGEVIMDYGRYIRFMPFIIKGTIRVMRQDDEGREILLYYLSASESCAMAYTCCISHLKSEVRAIAEDDIEILAIPEQKMDEWMHKFPSWKSYIMNSFRDRFNELLKTLESVAFHKLDERLVKYLRDKQRIGESSVVKASHQQIADELGTSRVVISRLLKQLENDQKLILYRNEIKLLKGFNE
jgi:CRP/FNR family transcriptional regulator, anaerobic regulatory protein